MYVADRTGRARRARRRTRALPRVCALGRPLALTRGGRRGARVQFYASWCGPCVMMSQELEKVSRKFQGQLKVIKVRGGVDAGGGGEETGGQRGARRCG